MPQTLTDLVKAAGKLLSETPTVETVSESCIPQLSANNSVQNTTNIRKMIATKNRAQIPPGPWPISNDIRMACGSVLEGLGEASNPAHLYIDSASPEIAKRRDAKCWFSIVQSNASPNGAEALVGEVFGLPYGPATGAQVRNLWLSGAFDRFDRPCTIQAVSLEGTAIEVSDVFVSQVAKGAAGGECFPIRIYAPNSFFDLGPSSIRRCCLLNVGNAKALHQGRGGDEITVFSIVGSPGGVIASPVIEDCEVRGIRRTSTQPSPIQVLHVASCVDAQVRNNTVADSDATGFYVDSGTSVNTKITGNTFRNVHRGVFVNGAITEDLQITNNFFSTYSDAYLPTWPVDSPPAGIVLRALAGSGRVFNRAAILNNVIIGGSPVGPTALFPRGIYIEAQNSVQVQDIAVAGNLIDVPRFGADARYYAPAVADQLAIYFAFAFAWHPRAMRVWANRSYAGAALGVNLVDDNYKYVRTEAAQ